jgi:hypothetical protein
VFKYVGCRGNKPLMKMLAYILAIGCVIIAAMYFILPRESLPTFLPGYLMGADRVYYLHGVAALAGAVIFLLVGLSVKPGSREQL